MKGIILLALLHCLLPYYGSSQPASNPSHRGVIRELASVPKIIKEASGLEHSQSGLLWTHNDDRLPVVYGLDTTGAIVRTLHLNHPNRGWEDLASDDSGNLYIGAFGNNRNDRKDLHIIRIGNPDSLTDRVINGGVIRFSYPEQRSYPPPASDLNFDADAFVVIGDSIYIFTKNRTQPFTGYSRVYRLPTSPGRYEATLCDSIFLGKENMMQQWVTAADVSPDGKSLALLSHDRLWLLTDFPSAKFSQGRITCIGLDHFTHKTGVVFMSDSRLYMIDELELGFLGGKIYALELDESLLRSTEKSGYPPSR